APVRSCLVFGVQADGAEVRTVEGLADGDELSDLQQAFRDHHALQCGFCTPGFLMLAEAYFAERGLVPSVRPPRQPPPRAGEEPPPSADDRPPPSADDRPPWADEEPSEAEIRELVASNLCRCTGYQGIVAAMLATARARRAAGREGRGFAEDTDGHAGAAQGGPPPAARPGRLHRRLPRPRRAVGQGGA